MAQIEVKTRLDLPPGAELPGYERCADARGKFVFAHRVEEMP
jgi:hypothetical protein